jgi:hypothetical protein
MWCPEKEASSIIQPSIAYNDSESDLAFSHILTDSNHSR